MTENHNQLENPNPLTGHRNTVSDIDPSTHIHVP